MSGADARSVAPRGEGASTQALYDGLRPRLGGPSPEQVGSHQRARLYSSMIRAVSEHGYGALTVRELCGLAGVSTRTFYEHFAGREDCFLGTYDVVMRRTARRVAAAQMHGQDWRERVRLGFEAFAHEVEHEHRAARLAFVDAFAAWPAVLGRMRRASAAFEALTRQSFALAPDGAVVPRLVAKGIVAGTARAARIWLLAGRKRERPTLAEELTDWALSLRSQPALLGQLEDACLRSPSVIQLARGSWTGAADERPRPDDRTRILEAAAELAASEGYWQLTVPHIRAAAGVSRKSFDERFEDTHACFIAAVEHLADDALGHAAAAPASKHGRPGDLHRALTALTERIAQDPVFARVVFVEALAPGPDGVRARTRPIAELLERFHTSSPAGQRPSELAVEASVGAIWGIVHYYVALGRAHRLPRLAGLLSFVAMAPTIGCHAAVKAIAGEQAST